MKWEILDSEQQFTRLLETEPVFAVFKHSTRCSISSMAKNRLEREWNFDFPIYYLDLIAHRDVSNWVAHRSRVEHQSPQLIVYSDGKAVYDGSHNFIYVNEVADALSA
ncbi:MAG TPA: bacillithiol system redox-active protein YtxJ [Chitinophagales bacterium]|nr:bacillithiol system redox-active protein YtxJ [Chitinophagales bacterium]